MHALLEVSDTLEKPIECFTFDTAKADFPIRPHWHYFVEMIYVTEGTAEMVVGKDRYIVPVDGFMLFHQKAVHSIFPVDDKPLIYEVLKFDINLLTDTPSYSPRLTNIFKGAEEKGMPIYFSPNFSRKHNCKKLFSICINEYKDKNYGYDLLIRAALYRLLTIIIRKWQTQGFTMEDSMYVKDSTYSIDNITEYIDQHIDETLDVSALADMCGISYSNFAKKFKRMYGVSCKEYIERYKIYKVEDYLLFTDFDLTYISQEVGFADCSHMIKQFKRYHDTTPKQFRMRGGA